MSRTGAGTPDWPAGHRDFACTQREVSGASTSAGVTYLVSLYSLLSDALFHIFQPGTSPGTAAPAPSLRA
eukprot:3975387-Pyramimonas_sp.AAC.1